MTYIRDNDIVESHGYVQEYQWARALAFEHKVIQLTKAFMVKRSEQTYSCYVTLLESWHPRPSVYVWEIIRDHHHCQMSLQSLAPTMLT